MSLGVVYILSKGLARKLLNSSKYAMLVKKYGVTTAVYQRLLGIGSMSFLIKPLTAILSGTFSFFGYTKRWYMALPFVVGAACNVVYGVLPFKGSSASTAAGVIFLSVFCIANIDVTSEDHFSRLIKRHPIPGADLISWIWAFIMVGQIVGSAIQGPLSDSGRPTIGIFISAGLQAICVVLFIPNWYGEKMNAAERREDYIFLLRQEAAMQQETDSEPIKDGMVLHDNSPDRVDVQGQLDGARSSQGSGANELVRFGELDDQALDNEMEVDFEVPTCMCGLFGVNKETITRNVSVAIYGVVIAARVIALTVLNLTGTTYELLYGFAVISVVLCVVGFLCILVTIMKANFFGWCQLVSYIMIDGAADNLCMTDVCRLPNGALTSRGLSTTQGVQSSATSLASSVCTCSPLSSRSGATASHSSARRWCRSWQVSSTSPLLSVRTAKLVSLVMPCTSWVMPWPISRATCVL